jgi:hypothetical protein
METNSERVKINQSVQGVKTSSGYSYGFNRLTKSQRI